MQIRWLLGSTPVQNMSDALRECHHGPEAITGLTGLYAGRFKCCEIHSWLGISAEMLRHTEVNFGRGSPGGAWGRWAWLRQDAWGGGEEEHFKGPGLSLRSHVAPAWLLLSFPVFVTLPPGNGTWSSQSSSVCRVEVQGYSWTSLTFMLPRTLFPGLPFPRISCIYEFWICWLSIYYL